ncbi:Arogenate dehydratase 3 [Trifolium repens]|nr:Arogenate dehydratase 3 [Trifolium repens]
MHTLASPSSNYLNRVRPSLNRFGPTQTRVVTVKCGYGFDYANFTQGYGVVSSRADWQSSCAILSSKVISQQDDGHNSGNGKENNHVGAVNGHNASVTDLQLVPIGNNKPQPLTITDLSPAPMHGSQLRVAYQGVPGAYSEAAAGKAYPNSEAMPCDQFEVAFQSVELWIADRAVLPVENSLGGSIHRNYDLLLRHKLHIVGEVQLPVHHCLLALPGIRKEYLTRVISHPQALAQCENTLTKLGLNVAREAVDDTAGAAEPHRGRPIRVVDDESEGTAKHFEYMFYIDFEASMAEVRAQNALAEVQEFTSFLRVLGSYPMDMTPWNSPSTSHRGD